MTRTFFPAALAIVVLTGLLAACGAQSEEGSGEVRMRLTDAPADEAESLDVDFGEMQLVPEGDEEGGIRVVADSAGSVNVLEYSNGGFYELGETTVPEGTYTQLRLIVDEASITFDGADAATHDVTVPSGAQTGLKIDLEPALKVGGGGPHEVRLDFDAGRAVVETGAGAYLLMPTALRAVTEPGEVTGQVLADDTGEPIEGATVEAYRDEALVTGATTEEDGTFAFVTLLEGGYRLEVSADGYVTGEVDVDVTAGDAVALDPIRLTPEPSD